MSLYSNYIFEKTGDKVLETDKGFAVYRYVNDDTVYIVDIYVLPDFRKQGIASNLADNIVEAAKAIGKKKLLGSVVTNLKNSTDSLKVLLAYGMKIDSCTNDFILLSKEI